MTQQFHVLLVAQVLGLVYGCQDVLDNCYAGQHGYTDPRYPAVDVSLSVLMPNSTADIDTFCRTFDDLKTCVFESILFCPIGSPLWEQWSATVLLNEYVCASPTGSQSQLFRSYKTCINTEILIDELDNCNALLAWNSTAFEDILDKNGLEKRCFDFDKYERCLENLVNNRCLGVVANWLKKYFAGSYFLQVCKNEFGSTTPGCLNSSPALDEKKQECTDTYYSDLSRLLSDAILGGSSSYETKACFVVRKYAKCELDAIAQYCGLRTAEAERQHLDDTLGSQVQQLNCRLDDLSIKEPTVSATIRPDPGSSSNCESITARQCRSLPYNSTSLPNIFHHLTQDAAQQAMDVEFSTELDAGCSPLITCFVCMLHFPVCSGLDRVLLPCRSLCESVQSSCGASWATEVQCDILPDYGLCLNADNCTAEADGTTPTVGVSVYATAAKTTVRGGQLPQRDIIMISLACGTVIVICIVIAVTVIIIKTRRVLEREQFVETKNPLYGQVSIAPSHSSSQTSNYDTIPDILHSGPVRNNYGDAVLQNPPGVSTNPSGAPTGQIELHEMTNLGAEITDDSSIADDTTWDSASYVNDVRPPSSVESPEHKTESWLNKTT